LKRITSELEEERKKNELHSTSTTEAHAKLSNDLQQEREKFAKVTDEAKGNIFCKEFSENE
jgi:hypothetical protein